MSAVRESRTPAGVIRRRLSPGRLSPLIALCVLALAGFLLYRTLSGYSLEALAASLADVPAARLLGALTFAGASYLCLTGFDWLALRAAGRPLPWRRAALASFCALSIGHNLGFAALSSGAIRYRFYARWGLSTGEIARVILFCGLTVGVGLPMIGGLAFLFQPRLAAGITGLSDGAILALGVVLLALVGLYLALAGLVRRPLHVRAFALRLPPLRLALAQVLVGTANFACVAAALHQCLLAVAEIGYPAALVAYVVANAGVLVSHVPGGLGVIEAVVTFLLPNAALIGGLLLFRIVYFLVPLALGGLVLAGAELLNRRRIKRASSIAAGGRKA